MANNDNVIMSGVNGNVIMSGRGDDNPGDGDFSSAHVLDCEDESKCAA